MDTVLEAGALLEARRATMQQSPYGGRTDVRPVSEPGTSLHRFAAMLAGYRAGGGLICSDTLELLLRDRGQQPFSVIARWIVSGTVVSFHQNSQLLFPLFQFCIDDMSLEIEVAQVTRELSDVLEGWELAAWFTSTNSWLDHRSPLEAIRSNPRGVFDAARADRYAARAEAE